MQGTALLADHQSIFPLTLTSLSNPLLYFSILCPPDTPSHCNIKFNDCHGVCFFLPHIPLIWKSCLKSSWWDSNHTDNKKGESYKAILFIKGETINYFCKYKDFFCLQRKKQSTMVHFHLYTSVLPVQPIWSHPTFYPFPHTQSKKFLL